MYECAWSEKAGESAASVNDVLVVIPETPTKWLPTASWNAELDTSIWTGIVARYAPIISRVCSPVRRITSMPESEVGSAAPARLVREPPECNTIPPALISDASIPSSNSMVSVPSERSSAAGPVISGLTPSICKDFENESESRVPGRGKSRYAARPDHDTDPPDALSEDTET